MHEFLSRMKLPFYFHITRRNRLSLFPIYNK